MNKSFKMNYLDWTALVLVVVGALNWGLVGAAHFLTAGANWNLVSLLFGGTAFLEFGIYLLVGLAALYSIGFAYRLATSETVETTEPEMAAEPEMAEGEASERRTA